MTGAPATPLVASLRQAASLLPRGGTLPADAWRRRHLFLVGLLALHAAALAAYVYGLGRPTAEVATVLIVLGAAAVLAAAPFLHSRVRSVAAALGLLSASATYMALSQGATESHLHMLVIAALLALYHEWLPLVVAALFIFLQHGILGTIDATLVYSPEGPEPSIWRDALLHMSFAVAAFACLALQWRTDEDLRDDARGLLSSTGEALLGLDPDGRIVFVNPAATRLLGLPEERLVGRMARALVPDLILPEARSTHAQAVTETTYRPNNRPAVPVECLATALVRRNDVRGYVLAVRDLSERRQAETEREAARQREVQRLHELAQARTQFINNAAHELRTPLMPLGLQLDVLELQIDADTPKPEHKGTMLLLRRNFDRLRQLVDDLVGAARLDAGRLQVRQEPVDLTASLRELEATFRPAASAQGHKLTLSCDEGLWVAGDSLRLHQVFTNLLANALRYTDPPGEIEVTARRRGANVEVRVKDDGPGLTEEQLGRLFQPFSQVQGSANERLGSGLGLYITRSLVAAHGGVVTAQSNGPGTGATFTVSLPSLPGGAPTADPHAVVLTQREPPPTPAAVSTEVEAKDRGTRRTG